MAAWVAAEAPASIFDPAVGPGTFLAAAREIGFRGSFSGFEVDGSVLAEGRGMGLTPTDLREIAIGDFLASTSRCTHPAIISNPPYIRHHRLTSTQKAGLRLFGRQFLGFDLDGRVGLHLHFLVKCLHGLSLNGRLAFLLPADVCEGVSSGALWNRIASRFRIEAVVSFAEAAAPFPGVDTNAMVFLISNKAPVGSLRWVRALRADETALREAVVGHAGSPDPAVEVHQRDLSEALLTGLSRPPRIGGRPGTQLLSFARVARGIATGANDFFFLTSDQITGLGLPRAFFRRAIGRTRDCPGDRLTFEDLEALDRSGRPTWLLTLAKQGLEELPLSLRHYLEDGTQQGLPSRSLIQTRTPWYCMEKRVPPQILFAYLGRRDCRFILNLAGVVPLTGFLCVFPWDLRPDYARRLWKALNHPETLANLTFVAKSYGGGALKVEPCRLEALEIPDHVLAASGIESPPTCAQMALLDAGQRGG